MATERGRRQLPGMSMGSARALALVLLMTLVSRPPPAQAAFPGTNGRIAFDSSRDGNYEIYSMNPDGSDQTNLSNNAASDTHAAWSADGTKLAFASDRDGDTEVYAMNADGSGQTNLSNNASFDYNPAWSPDGTRIAFVSLRDGDPEIFVMNADGSGQIQLTFNGSADDEPSWSPDGTKIAYSNQVPGGVREIFTMDPSGAGQTNLTNTGTFNANPDWSPDGTQIAYNGATGVGGCGPDCEVFTMNADGSGQTNRSNNPASDSSPAWSPDGSQIAFQSNRDHPSGEIYSMSSGGSGVAVRLTFNADEDARAAWQPADATPPVPVCVTARKILWPARRGLLDVRLTLTATDNRDPNPSRRVRVFSDEENGATPYAPDASVAGASLRCRAERLVTGAANGRVYVIDAQAVDVNGNVGHDCCTVVVPRILTTGHITALLLEAEAAEASCDASGTGTPSAPWGNAILGSTNLP